MHDILFVPFNKLFRKININSSDFLLLVGFLFLGFSLFTIDGSLLFPVGFYLFGTQLVTRIIKVEIIKYMLSIY